MINQVRGAAAAYGATFQLLGPLAAYAAPLLGRLFVRCAALIRGGL